MEQGVPCARDPEPMLHINFPPIEKQRIAYWQCFVLFPNQNNARLHIIVEVMNYPLFIWCLPLFVGEIGLSK